MVAKINAGDIVKFFAMYEPTKKQTRVGKRSSNILIADENDRKEWVKRKFINAGNVIAINELSKNRRQVTKSCGDSHPVSVFGYEFLLRVSDANALRNLIKNGVGRSKSYGAGMSLVMGVEKQKNNLKKINLQKIKKKLGNIFSSIGSKFKKIKPVEFGVGAVVIVLSCVVIVPSLVQCVINRNKAKCSAHMSIMLNMLSDELTDEMKTGETYWHDLIQNGNYQKLISSLNEKTGLSKKYPSTNYYIRTGEEKLALMCKKHKDISDKEIKFALMKDVSVEVAEKPQIGEKIAYLTVSGPDTYYEDDMLDENNPTKMVFIGREVDKVIKNLTVTAVYAGGAREELPRSKYTVTADKLNMKKSGQTHLTVKSNSSSLWDNSAYAQFVIDVVGDDDIAPLIVDSGTNGRFELASWEWNDFVTEAAQEDGKKSFGASIIRYNGNYYYYPDGLTIVNDNKNNDMFKFALDVDDETKPAYYIQFDTSSVVINDNDSKIHNGSVKIENDLIYIWQEKSSKELDTGWIRVYCDLKKY